MSNNKQSSVEWLDDELASLNFDYLTDQIGNKKYNERHKVIIQQAKAQHKKETIDFALHCMMPKLNPDKSTIEVVSDIYDEVFGGDQ